MLRVRRTGAAASTSKPSMRAAAAGRRIQAAAAPTMSRIARQARAVVR